MISKWLLVEDEPDLYEVLTYLYRGLGSEAIGHATGEDVMAWLDTLPKPSMVDPAEVPVFGLIDIRLPGDLNGIQVAQYLRQHPLMRDMPIVLMTAYRLSPRQEREALRRSGANRVIYKPLPPFSELHQLFIELTSIA